MSAETTDSGAGERRKACGFCAGERQTYDGPHITWRPCPFCATADADDATDSGAGEPPTLERKVAALFGVLSEMGVTPDAATRARTEERERIAQAMHACREMHWKDRERAARIARGDA